MSTTPQAIGDYKAQLTEGVRFNYIGFYANGRPQPSYTFSTDSERWHVERVVERGVVVSHPWNKGHQHLLEWNKPIVAIKFA